MRYLLSRLPGEEAACTVVNHRERNIPPCVIYAMAATVLFISVLRLH